MKQHLLYIKVHELLQKNARYVTPAALLFGFIVDNIILQRIDTLFTFSIILYHFSVITLGILLLHATAGKGDAGGKYIQLIQSALGLIIPFSFGALFSGFFIFYSQSTGSLLSWGFLALLMLFMISTEYYKKHYINTLVQVTLWYFTLLSFLILYLPIALKHMNGAVFLLGGFLSLFITAGFLGLLARIEPVRYSEYAPRIIRNIALVLVVLNILYFTNIIPPIPLAMKDIGVYYNVVHNAKNGTYTLTEQKLPWYSPQKYTNTKIYHMPNAPIYVYSSVFAPDRLSPKLYHQWQYKNDKGLWQTASTISYDIVGGRTDGYRWYTLKRNVWDGAWRERIITEREQVVGTTYFTITDADSLPELVDVVK
jgi:hypothetical protein